MGVLRVGGQPQPGDRRELVFLVHGMGRTPLSMFLLGRRLESAGYRVASFGYLSTTGTVGDLGAALGRKVQELAGEAPCVHFVGHSLGNIIVRWLLAHERPARAGRVVMLAPPNQGAAAADRWSRWVGWALPTIHELRNPSPRPPPAPCRSRRTWTWASSPACATPRCASTRRTWTAPATTPSSLATTPSS